MSTTRREFLSLSTAAVSYAVLGARPRWTCATQDAASRPAKSMRILILGGTGFLGPHTVEAAQKRGHTLTFFNRGKTNPGLFPDIEKLHGDRDPQKGDGLKALEGRQWDVVVDNSGYVPRMVRASAELLRNAAQQYIFISSISVYSDTSKPGLDESGPVGKLEDETVEKITGETYGPLKALCEQTAERTMPGRTTVIRPGLIVGPGDPSDRFTYWPVRVQRGGEVLAPGTPDDPVQVIDVRDLGAWIVKVIEDGVTGVFNATGPKDPFTIGALLKVCKSASGSDATFTWADADFLAEQKVTPWSEMPVWVPPRGDDAGFAQIDCRRAIGKGLTFRPVEDTVQDTLAWWKTLPEERRGKLKAGLKPEREVEVLKAWHESRGK